MNDTMLWCATVRNKSFEERIEAAQAGDFPAMSMFPTDYHTYTNEGLSAEEIRTLMTESGVDVTVLDPFTKWVPKWSPPEDMSDEDLAFADFDEDEFFEMGAALDVDSINLVESFGNEVSIDAAAESFGQVCDRAADHGWQVHLEFMPISGIPDLETAWAIVNEADRPNGGLLFDMWHYFRVETRSRLAQVDPGRSDLSRATGGRCRGSRGIALQRPATLSTAAGRGRLRPPDRDRDSRRHRGA